MRLGHSVWFNDTDGFQNLADTQINLQERDRQADGSTDTEERLGRVNKSQLTYEPKVYNQAVLKYE
jgi:hypothetical protein